MAFFGLFGSKPPQQPAQPASGEIETGIPAGAPQQPSNPNTLGGLMPNPPVREQSSSGNLEETGTWAAEKAGLDAERAAAAPTPLPVTSTPPMGTFGVSPTPEAIASVQDEGVTPPPAEKATAVESPAEQFAAPVSEGTEINAPDTGPSSGPVAETPTPAIAPVAETVETSPPPFSMDALTPPQAQPEVPAPPAEPADGRETPTVPDEIPLPTAVTPEPILSANSPPPEIPTLETANETPEALPVPEQAKPPVIKDTPFETAGTMSTPVAGLEPLANAATATPEPVNMPIQHQDNPDEHAVEPPPAEGEPPLKLVPTPDNENPAEEKPDNVVPFPGSVETPAEAQQPTPPETVAQTEPSPTIPVTEPTPSPTELPQAA